MPTRQEEFGLYQSAVAQMQVYHDAVAIFEARNAVHNDLWKSDGADGSIEHMRHKMARIRKIRGDWDLIDGPDDEDFVEAMITEALDLLNYTVFMIRNLRDGRLLDRKED